MSNPSEAHKLVNDAIRRLGLPRVISDSELDKELDELIAYFTGAYYQADFGLMMSEARRRFLYRADLDKVGEQLAMKLKTSRIAESS